METFLQIIQERFIWGLALGLLFTFFVWKTGYTTRSHLRKENKRVLQEMDELQGHLNTQLKISATGNDALTSELEDLKTQNENLRVNISTLQQKPEKTELKHLHITENAVRMMREQAPGFATAWEKALRSAEEEYNNSENGLTKLVKKVLPNYGSSSSKEVKTIDVSEDS